MPERRLATLAEAQRQVRMRWIMGSGLIVLAMIVLLLFLLKHLYQSPADLFFSWGPALRQRLDPFLDNWPGLAALWRVIPPRQPTPIVPTTPLWEYVYTVWAAFGLTLIGGRLLRSAQRRQAQITAFHEEMQREAWREQARAARGVAPGDRSAMTVIQQGIWHQYAAPPEPWSQTGWGNLIISLGITVGGGLIVGYLLLQMEYRFFQGQK